MRNRSQDYTFRAWLADVVLWAGATYLDAERHGPAVAMQVTGAAREVIREIPAEVLRQGRALPNGQMETGLMILMRTLAERYSPLEVESSTRSIAELINLRRLGSESIDSYLTRFDILRTRAVNRANFQMGVPGLAWMLLNGLRAPPDLWDQALIPFNGNLPQDNNQLAILVERLRRQGHLHEQNGIAQLGRDAATRQGGTGGNAMYFFPTFEGQPSTTENRNNGVSWEGGDAHQHYPAGETMGTSAEHGSCPTCGHYFGGDESSETSSDDGMDAYFGEGSLETGMDMNELGNVLHNDYHIAKKRWRRFQNKMPRRRRRFGGKGSRPPAFASFLPSRAFAGGKGKGGGKNSKKNPVDSNGRTLRCHNCGSEEHLVKHCPTRSTSHHVTASGSGGPHGSGQGVITTSSWHARPSEVEDLVQMLPKRSRSDEPQAEPPTEIVRLLPGFGEPLHPPPTWTPTLPSSVSMSSPQSIPPRSSLLTWTSLGTRSASSHGYDAVAASAPPVSAGAQSMRDHASEVGSSVSQAAVERRTSTEQSLAGLSRLLHGGGRGCGQGLHFPWWHSDCPVDMVYHTKTRLKSGKAALLVDPGAHGNLIGSQTMAQLVAQAASYGHSSRKRTLARQMSVEGVGKQAPVAKHEEEVAIGFKDMSGQVHVGKFTAPVIDDSALPPLWGRSSLAEQKAILDVGNNCLILPGPGGVEMRLSPGSMTLPLTMSESGHLLLEVHHFGNSKLKSSQEEVHSFAGKGAEEMTSIHDGRPPKANRKEGRVAFN